MPPHEKSRDLYTAEEQSKVVQWLRYHHVPVISGVSGGIGVTVSRLSKIIELTKEEHSLLTLLVASSTIALGHHSFFEVVLPMAHANLIAPIKEQGNLLEFYQQVIPASIQQMQAYQDHIKSRSRRVIIRENGSENIDHTILSLAKDGVQLGDHN